MRGSLGTCTSRRARVALLLLAAFVRPASALDCPTGGLCVGPLCVGGSSTPCPDDGIACTEERCDPVRGCVHEPVAARCEDGDPCTAGFCDPGTGCAQAPATGPACEDGDAALVLAGRIDVPAEPRPRVVAETSAQRRARAAAGRLARAPREARALLRALAGRDLRAALGREYAVALRRRARELVRGIVALKADLARVQEVLGSFVRRAAVRDRTDARR